MKVHHLNCGTMNPPLTEPTVCHVLLVETGTGLVLVDSGFGSADIAAPASRIGPARKVIRPVLSPQETAANQVAALGFDIGDVTDIVLTHLDFDHVGGVGDFPGARVHTTAVEATVARDGSVRSRMRFRDAGDVDPSAVISHAPGAESWRGFDGVTEITEGILLLPLPGHTRGHAAVAVDAGAQWILHAGDAFFHRAVIGDPDKMPVGMRLAEMIMAEQPWKVAANHRRLAQIAADNDQSLRVICAHDPVLFERARQAG